MPLNLVLTLFRMVKELNQASSSDQCHKAHTRAYGGSPPPTAEPVLGGLDTKGAVTLPEGAAAGLAVVGVKPASGGRDFSRAGGTTLRGDVAGPVAVWGEAVVDTMGLALGARNSERLPGVGCWR
jgi:hypothetical protein